MTTENSDVAKTDDELFEEAFNAEYTGAEPDELTPEQPVAEETAVEEATAESTEEQDTEEEIDYKGKLDSALAAIDKLQKALDTTNGTYGQKLSQMNTVITELTRRLEQQQQGGKVLIPKVKLDKLKEAEYGELADLLQNVFDESFKEFNELPQQPAFNPDEYVQKFDARIDEVNERIRKREQEMELRLLRREHPDYAEVAGYATNEVGMVVWNNLDFGNWAASQLDVDSQRQLMTSDDAGFLSSIITKYKESRKAEEPQTITDKKHTGKEAVLENAVRPKNGARSTTSVAKTDDELFREAFIKELRSF